MFFPPICVFWQCYERKQSLVLLSPHSFIDLNYGEIYYIYIFSCIKGFLNFDILQIIVLFWSCCLGGTSGIILKIFCWFFTGSLENRSHEEWRKGRLRKLTGEGVKNWGDLTAENIEYTSWDSVSPLTLSKVISLRNFLWDWGVLDLDHPFTKFSVSSNLWCLMQAQGKTHSCVLFSCAI